MASRYGGFYSFIWDNAAGAKAGVGACFRFYNEERRHQALDFQTPRQVFEAGRRSADAKDGRQPTTAPEAEMRCSPNREVVSWSWSEPASLIMTTSNTAEDSLNLASSLSK